MAHQEVNRERRAQRMRRLSMLIGAIAVLAGVGYLFREMKDRFTPPALSRRVEAEALANQRMPEAVLVEIEIHGARADGRVDMDPEGAQEGRGRVDYAFASVMGPCTLTIRHSESGLEIVERAGAPSFAPDPSAKPSCPVRQPIVPPRCDPGEIFRRAQAAGFLREEAVMRFQRLPDDAPDAPLRWRVRGMGDYGNSGVLLPDDC